MKALLLTFAAITAFAGGLLAQNMPPVSVVQRIANAIHRFTMHAAETTRTGQRRIRMCRLRGEPVPASPSVCRTLHFHIQRQWEGKEDCNDSLGIIRPNETQDQRPLATARARGCRLNVEVMKSWNAERPAVRCIAWLDLFGGGRSGCAKRWLHCSISFPASSSSMLLTCCPLNEPSIRPADEVKLPEKNNTSSLGPRRNKTPIFLGSGSTAIMVLPP